MGYGLPLHCPKCPPKDYFGFLKVPGSKSVRCPNCGSALVDSNNLTKSQMKKRK